jgi:hypothetical protein
VSAEAEFVAAFAAAIVEREFEDAASMLAPWLQAALSPEALKKLVRRARGDNPPADSADVALLSFDSASDMRDSVAEHAGENGPRTLATWDGTGADFGPPSFPIPDGLTDDNYRGVFRVEFVPDPDLGAEVDFSYAFFLAVVEGDDGFAVGYLEPAD